MRHEVSDGDTAAALRSGDVAVLWPSRLLAWVEAATVLAAAGFLAPGQTTVGTAVRLEHRRATPVGGSVTVSADARDAPDGRRLTFTVRAVNRSGRVVAEGEIDRVIVDRAPRTGCRCAVEKSRIRSWAPGGSPMKCGATSARSRRAWRRNR